MEKIEEIKYKGFKTEFYITDKIKKYLEKENINFNELKQKDKKDNENYSFFYEVLLFEILDENNDGIPDEKFGKNFKVIYYSIKKRKKDHNTELEQDIIDEIKEELNFKDEINEGTKKISTNKNYFFEIKYKIIKNEA